MYSEKIKKLHLSDANNWKLSGFLGKPQNFGPGSKERATQLGAGARRQLKSQSLTAEEGQGPLPPLFAEGFSRQRMPCVWSGLCAVHGYCNCLYGVKWKPEFTSWLPAVQWLGALGQWWDRAASPSHALNIHCAAIRAGHRAPQDKVMSSLGRRSDGWKWVREVDMGAIIGNAVLERTEGFAAYFMKVSGVCSCGEVNLLCARPLQQWDAASCAGGHTEAVGHPAGIHVLLHQCWDLLSRDCPGTPESWANSLRGASSRCRAKELWDLSLSACSASTLLGCTFS